MAKFINQNLGQFLKERIIINIFLSTNKYQSVAL